MIRKILQIGKQYSHGLILRVLALSAKFAFLILVVPFLPEGVYTDYLFLFTLMLISARILSLGAEEHLPTIVRGDEAVRDDFVPLFILSFAVSAAALAVYGMGQHKYALMVAIVAQLASGWTLGGLTRSIDPKHYERLLNIPVILFVLICFITPPTTVLQLLLTYCLSNLVVQLAIAIGVRLPMKVDLRSVQHSLPPLIKSMVPGAGKTISNIVILFNIRGLVILPKLLLGVTVADALALAISIGEAFWQLAMVVCMRNYAAYCRGEGSWRSMAISAGVLFSFLSFLGLALLLIPIPIVIPKIEWALVGWSLLFFASLSVFMEVRYYFWAKNINSVAIIVWQLVFIAILMATVLFIDPASWFPVTSTIAAIVAILFLGRAFLSSTK